MGEADITTNVGNSGLRIFNTYKKKNFEPLEKYITEEYVEEYNMQVILTSYINWLVTTSIPKYFDEDLKSNSTLNLNTITVKNYISKVVLIRKTSFQSTVSGNNLSGLQG